MSLDPLEVHRTLMRSLPVRTVRCEDQDDGEDDSPALADNSALEGEEQMLAKMKAGVWYSAKHLAALAGMREKFFYTHVRRMVSRKQLVRAGSRHSFRYRKAAA